MVKEKACSNLHVSKILIFVAQLLIHTLKNINQYCQLSQTTTK